MHAAGSPPRSFARCDFAHGFARSCPRGCDLAHFKPRHAGSIWQQRFGESPMYQHRSDFIVLSATFACSSEPAAKPVPVRQSPHAAQANGERAWAPLVALVLAALLGTVIPAVAVATSKHFSAAETARWRQTGFVLPAPPSAGVDQRLY
jgi:hypothetical protein